MLLLVMFPAHKFALKPSAVCLR
jgi:hypothetical protein